MIFSTSLEAFLVELGRRDSKIWDDRTPPAEDLINGWRSRAARTKGRGLQTQVILRVL